MRTINEEEVKLSEYLDLDDARGQIECFIEDVHNQTHPFCIGVVDSCLVRDRLAASSIANTYP